MFDDHAHPESPTGGALVPQPTPMGVTHAHVTHVHVTPVAHEPPELLDLVERAIDAALDLADQVADDIAAATGFGPPRVP